MQQPFFKYVGLIIFIALGLTACGDETGTVIRDSRSIPPSSADKSKREALRLAEENNLTAQREIRLGFLVPLSGPDAAIGKAFLNAATLALFDSQDQRLILVPMDTRGTADGAVLAMTALLEQKPDLIIGPLFSHSILAIKPMAQQAGINIIGFSSDYTVAGDGVFLMNFRIEKQIERIVRFASDQGYAHFAALIPETPYGTRALETFSASVLAQKRELAAIEYYPSDSTKLVKPVKNIAHYNVRRRNYIHEKNFLQNLGENDDFAQEMLDELKGVETLGKVDFDSILLPEGGSMLTTLAAWVSYYEIDPEKIKILGTGLWDDEMLFFEPQLYGGWFAAPDHNLSNQFLARCKDIFGQEIPRLSTLAYDSVALAATLVRHSKTADFSREKITNENGFSGIEGIFRFTSDGLIERGLAVYEIGAKQFTVVDPAPTSFIEMDMPNPLLEIKQADDQAPHSEAASPAPLPANDGRPFPYNPIQKSAENTLNQ